MRREISLSIIIPTLNEAKNLPLLLSDLAEIKEISEIIVIDSNSKDATKDIASIYGAKCFNTIERNRGFQLNKGAKSAKGNWLLFIHADSRLNQNWSKEISNILSLDNKFIYFFRFKVNNNSLIFRFLELIVNLRTLILKTPYGDQGLLINREIYFKYGGYKNIPIMEDIDFINRIKVNECLCELNSSILTSSRKWQKKNLLYQSIINFNLRRKWAKGYSLDDLYKKYYEK
mgnify:CR=1 FL=1